MMGLRELNGILLLLIATCGAQRIIKTFQTTTWNDHISDKAVDANKTSCAVTGYDFKPEWTAVLDANYSIHDVYIKGDSIMPNLRISVNDNYNINGRVCSHWIRGPVPLPDGINFNCGQQVPIGNKVSISSTVTTVGQQLKLCDVTINAKPVV